MAVLGMRGVGDWSTNTERPLNYRQAAFKLFPDSPAPFTFFLSKLPSSTVDDSTFRIFEWRLPEMAFTINGEVAIDATTLIFDSPTTPTKNLKEGDLLRDETSGEIVRVSQTPVSPFLNATCERYIGSSNTGAVIADNSILRWVGSSYEDGSRSPTAVSRNHDVVTNYTQIFKDTAKMTGTAKATRFRPQKSDTQLQGEALERHMQKLELAFLYGIKSQGTGAGGEEIRTTGGLKTTVTTNVTDFSSTGVSLDTFEDALRDVFKYGSKSKLGIAGNQALNIMNRLASRNSLTQYDSEILDKKNTFGLHIVKFVTPFGNLNLMPHPLMTESDAYTQDMFIVDPKNVEYVSLRGRDTDWHPKAQIADEDAWKGFYQTEAGLRLGLEETHGIMTGLNAYVG